MLAPWAEWEVPQQPGRTHTSLYPGVGGRGRLVMGALLGTKLPTAELCENMTTCIQALGDVAGGALLRTGAALGRTRDA